MWYECRICLKSYSTLKSLKRHQKYECGPNTQQFKCLICNHVSNRKDNLQTHMLNKHGVVRQEPQTPVISFLEEYDSAYDDKFPY